jgi:hypothetical protein
MKEKFDFPEITIYSFSASDIVTASVFTDEGDNEGVMPDGQ